MTTINDLRLRVGRLLSDTELEGYEPELFFDAISAALDAILPWVPKTGVHTITGDGSATSFELPVGVYDVEACVVNNSGEILPHSVLVPGYYRDSALAETNDWIEYPHGYITFSKAITSGETYTMYYLATWTKPVSNDTGALLDAPDFTIVGLSLYAAAYMMLPAATSSAEVRQWATKVDSGNPEHNPMMKSANYLLRLFTDEMNRHPKHQKAQK